MHALNKLASSGASSAGWDDISVSCVVCEYVCTINVNCDFQSQMSLHHHQVVVMVGQAGIHQSPGFIENSETSNIK